MLQGVRAYGVVLIAAGCLCAAGQTKEKQDIGVIVEDFWGWRVVKGLADNPTMEENAPITLERDVLDLRRFITGRCAIVALSMYPATDPKRWIYGFPAPVVSRTSYMVGQAKVMAIASRQSALEAVSFAQLRRILSKGGKGLAWRSLRARGGKVTVYGERKGCITRSILQRTVMAKTTGGRRSRFDPYGENWHECPDRKAVIRKVAVNPSAIGFVLQGDAKPTAVKVLSVRRTPQEPAVRPTDGPSIQPDYPLAEPLILYLHPSQPMAAKRFCEFAIGRDGSAIAGGLGLTTPHMQRVAEGSVRLAQMRAGRGVRIHGTGVVDARKLMPASAVEYVKAKAVAQMLYLGVIDELSAVGHFVRGKELLVLAAAPGEEALAIHGSKWRAMEPERHVLGGRAVAIVAHAMNKLDHLTAEQVRVVFVGQIDDWGVLGAKPAAGKTAIQRYGLGLPDEAAKLFYRKVLTAHEAGLIQRKKDSAAVLAAVSMEPNAIAFVDYVDLPAEPAKAGVKVLAVGKEGAGTWPSRGTILSGTYPLSERLYLYVNPSASPTAKDFVKFVLSGGGAAANPYVDVPKAVGEAFRKHGFVGPAPKAPASQPASLPARHRAGMK